MLSAVTEAKLRIIADQIRLLQDEARKALSQAKESFELHQARCSFSRRVGVTYHLYESTEKYWSMLSPEEWNGTPPHRFLGSYRLLADQSWERVPNQST